MNFNCKLAGYYKIEKVNKDTLEREVVADWFKNQIFQSGIDVMNRIDVLSTLMLSHNSTDPYYTTPLIIGDTPFVDMRGSQYSSPNSYYYPEVWSVLTPFSSRLITGAPDYYGYYRKTFRYNPNTLSSIEFRDVSIGWVESTLLFIDTLNVPTYRWQFKEFSRATIKDNNNLPKSIEVAANEYLDITYELRLYPPLTDTYGTLLFNGNIHDVTYRAMGVNPGGAGSPGWTPGTLVDIFNWPNVHTGSIGPINGSPSGTSSQPTGLTILERGNSFITFRTLIPLDSGTFATTGIKSFSLNTWYMGAFQAEFNPPIPKPADATIEFIAKLTWEIKND